MDANKTVAQKQLRLSTGKRVNSAADDVAAYITSKSLQARTSALNGALNATGEAQNVTSIVQDAYDNISSLLTQIKDSAAQAATGALGTDEKVALAKSSYRLAQQIQFVTDSTVFGGKQLLQGAYSGSWVIGLFANNDLLKISIDLTTTNTSDFNITKASGFDLNAIGSTGSNGTTINTTATANFAGVSGLDLSALNSVSSSNLGVFSSDNITATLQSLASALGNITNVASYVGGVQNRIGSQEELLSSQITNYNSAVSRLTDADVAKEQLDLVKAQFLQQTSIISLAQANQGPQQFLRLFQ
jgi:flagellin